MNKSYYMINNVSKYYYLDNEKHIVLKDIILRIDSSDITVILGESGCGKTTLLRIIAKLEEASKGHIKYIKDNQEYEPKVGLVFQESRLMPWLNVCENIAFHEKKENGFLKRLKQMSNKTVKQISNKAVNSAGDNKIDEYLKMMKLMKFKNSYPDELSGGMVQRVSIARALYFDPDILLMDEPFSALDYFTRMDMQNELIKIHKTTNKGIIFVTHDIDEALRIADKIIVFTKDYSIREFRINGQYERDEQNDYFINMKKEILKALNHNADE